MKVADQGQPRGLTISWVLLCAVAPLRVHHVRGEDGNVKAEVPAWAADAVWYQIFVSRFRNGELANDPTGCRPWSHEWTAADAAGKSPSRTDFLSVRYGGDLQGVLEKLPYLRDLGVNTLYLNPIFEAQTEHKYDTSDHRHVDATFGGLISNLRSEISVTTDPATWKWTESDRVFLELLRRAHAARIRVVIDGVFNHVGQGFWAWKDVLARGRESPYAGWFEVVDWGPPMRWSAWDGENGRLVRFKRTADGLAGPVEDYLFAITRRWMDPDGDGDPADGVDGWRLDAAGEVHHGFWKRWRKLVKSVNPQALIVGEIWTPAQEWLRGDEFDVVTNYQFAVPVVRWLRPAEFKIQNSEFKNGTDGTQQRSGATGLLADLEKLRNTHPWPVTLGMVNLLGSHDTDRLASMMFNPGREYDKESRPGEGQPFYSNGSPDAEALRRAKLAAFFQFTYVGAPMVYYGEELGMYGGDDPYCRAPMWWPDLAGSAGSIPAYASDMLEYYRALTRLRREHAALRRGDFRLILADDARGIIAFGRSFADEWVGVALNFGREEQRVTLTLPVRGVAVRIVPFPAVDAVEKELDDRPVGADGQLALRMPGLSAMVLTPGKAR